VRKEVYSTWASIGKLIDKTLLARSFKSCLCQWLTACFDQTLEVASAAKSALPFGPGKYRPALLHYKTEILRGVSAQLAQTPQSLSEGRSFVTEQDAQQIWENLVSASLLLLVHLCQELGSQEGAEFCELIVSDSITKLFSSASSVVRRSCLSVVLFLSKSNLAGKIAEPSVRLCLSVFENQELTNGI
jgi:hypothetical protein